MKLYHSLFIAAAEAAIPDIPVGVPQTETPSIPDIPAASSPPVGVPTPEVVDTLPQATPKQKAPAATPPQAPKDPVKPPTIHDGADWMDRYPDDFLNDPYSDHPAMAYDDDELSHDWDELMVDFQADLMVTVQIPANTKELFFEDVTVIGTQLRGAFFVAPDKERRSGVNVFILDPNNKKVYTQSGKGEAIFSVKADMVGTYTFVIENTKWVSTRQVTFIVGSGSRTTLKQEHLMTMEDRIKAVDDSLQKIQKDGGFMWIRQKSQLQAIEAVNSRVFWFTAFEFFVLVVVAVVQVYYIKGMLSYRRLY